MSTTTVRTLKQALPATAWRQVCTTGIDNIAGDNYFPGGYKEIVSFDGSSRSKPQGPLWMHATVYPFVSETEHSYAKAVQERKASFFTYHPYPKIVPYTHTHHSWELVATLGTSYISFPSLDWPLAIRLKIKDESVNLGASLAEYRQTASMFKTTALALFNMYRGIKKTAFKAISKSLSHKPYVKFKNGKPSQTYFREQFSASDITDAYLMTRYGINPLMGDIFNSVNQLQQRVQGDVWQKCYVKLSETVSVGQGTEGVSGSGTTSCKATAWILLNTDGDFTVGNPLELAHELTPYSFVLDWMFNLGDILKSLDALKNVSAVYGTVSFKSNMKLRRTGNWGKGVIEGNEEFSRRTFHRSLFNAATLPHASFVPSYKSSTSLTNVVDGLALLAQIRRG